VDAREQLRRYLEQRREMGETELVLDHMTVEETLAVLGVRRGGDASATPASAAQTTRENAHENAHESTHENAHEKILERDRGTVREDRREADADWRQALRAAGASPETMPKKPTLPAEPDKAAPPPPTPTRETPTRETPTRETPTRPERTTGSPLSDVPAGLSVGSPMQELLAGEFPDLGTLDEIATRVAGCTRCTLYSTATNPVPGEGNPNADFMCVGEAPGATEDETGRPFIGAAGQLLTKILAAIDLQREDVYICNVLKHRPPGNRNPRPEEVTACSPYLIRQIELIRPKVILALGTFAAQTLLDTKLSIGKLRGQVHRYYGVPLIVTYHPAALLRNPGWKRPTWEDVKLAHRILDSAAESESGA
jgi:uracil-DNA glycosylase